MLLYVNWKFIPISKAISKTKQYLSDEKLDFSKNQIYYPEFHPRRCQLPCHVF